jgi:hypothetical protein
LAVVTDVGYKVVLGLRVLFTDLRIPGEKLTHVNIPGEGCEG